MEQTKSRSVLTPIATTLDVRTVVFVLMLVTIIVYGEVS